jgi:hypothetical protein
LAGPRGLSLLLLGAIARPTVSAVLLIVPIPNELLRDSDGGRNGYADGRAGEDLLARRYTLIVVVVVILVFHFQPPLLVGTRQL